MNEVRRPVPGRATYQDVMDAPPNTVAELVDGVLHLSPRPAAPHAFTAGAIGAEIMAPFGYGRSGPGGWWIVPGPELHFDADVLVPDLAGWRRERMPVYPSGAAFDMAPDWVCEIQSPSTRTFDVTVKRRRYGAVGVGRLWMVDPLARTLETFVLRAREWVLAAARAGDDEVRLPPFEAVAFPLGALWPD